VKNSGGGVNDVLRRFTEEICLRMTAGTSTTKIQKLFDHGLWSDSKTTNNVEPRSYYAFVKMHRNRRKKWTQSEIEKSDCVSKELCSELRQVDVTNLGNGTFVEEVLEEGICACQETLRNMCVVCGKCRFCCSDNHDTDDYLLSTDSDEENVHSGAQAEENTTNG
jgi:hypothetical protein